MKITEIPIGKLKFNEKNPRVKLHKNDKMFQCLLASITTFGLQLPLLINKDYEVISGNQTLSVLKFLNWKEIPCIISNIKERKESDLGIALNKIRGFWYVMGLRKYFKEKKYTEE